MYKSPIQANYTDPMYEQVRDAFDNEVFKAVQAVSIEVDKDELIKALRYDREQYDKGYWDGRMYRPPIATNADRIRAMTDEELAKLCQNSCCRAEYDDCPTQFYDDCVECWLDWLKQEEDNA